VSVTRIVIEGLPFSGKTSLGRGLASALGARADLVCRYRHGQLSDSRRVEQLFERAAEALNRPDRSDAAALAAFAALRQDQLRADVREYHAERAAQRHREDIRLQDRHIPGHLHFMRFFAPHLPIDEDLAREGAALFSGVIYLTATPEVRAIRAAGRAGTHGRFARLVLRDPDLQRAYDRAAADCGGLPALVLDTSEMTPVDAIDAAHAWISTIAPACDGNPRGTAAAGAP
jgi:thymidylate kinase